MKRLCSFFLFCALASGQPNSLTKKEVADGWLLLFDGESMFGWTSEGGAQWKVESGAIVANGGEYGWLRSNSVFADYVLKCDFRTSADGNSGLFLRSKKEGAPHETGYELQIFDQHPKFPTGSLVNYLAAKGGKIKAGAWQMYEVHVSGGHFVVKLDGKKVLEGDNSHSAVGHIGLQYNKGKKIEFRNVKVKPEGLQPLFNGKNLSGWKKVEPAKPPAAPAEWSATKGMLHVEKGPGQLETEKPFADFVLRLDVRTNTQDQKLHPNSGVFFRGTPNTWWSGYESQIRNEYTGEDRTKPVDYGTGAIYRNQATRKVVPNDNEFFTKTIVARGRHLGVWVNGYPVTSWEDSNPEGASVRDKQAVLKAGVISLQAHDPKTNLDFKNIQAVELPK